MKMSERCICEQKKGTKTGLLGLAMGVWPHCSPCRVLASRSLSVHLMWMPTSCQTLGSLGNVADLNSLLITMEMGTFPFRVFIRIK